MSSVKAQRVKVLKVLKQNGPKGCSTIEFREYHDIMHSAGRIMELRAAGHDIRTIWLVTKNAQGYTHRNARYLLISMNHG